jgi:hypothetical protein
MERLAVWQDRCECGGGREEWRIANRYPLIETRPGGLITANRVERSGHQRTGYFVTRPASRAARAVEG